MSSTDTTTCEHGGWIYDTWDSHKITCEDCGTRGTIPACTVDGHHCEQCGSTDYEDVELGDQGYTACCNEIATYRGDCRAHHNSPTWATR
jgi:uncharacterized OB-fold protein